MQFTVPGFIGSANHVRSQMCISTLFSRHFASKISMPAFETQRKPRKYPKPSTPPPMDESGRRKWYPHKKSTAPKPTFKFITTSPNQCTGCGSEMQSDDPHAVGYVPSQLKGKTHKPSGYKSARDFTDIFEKEIKHIESIVKNEKRMELKKELEETLKEMNINPKEVDPQTKERIMEKIKQDKEQQEKENEKKQDKPVVCQRCFMLKHYGKVVPVSVPLDTFRDKLSALKRTPDQKFTVFKIIDIFDVSSSFIKGFHTIVGKAPVILVATKCDLLPKNVHKDRVKTWLRNLARENNLYLKGIYLVSALNGEGMDDIVKRFNRLREGGDVFVVGTSNAGKSTFINKLIETWKLSKMHLSPSTHSTTVSPVPGTTLDFISIPIPSSPKSLYDTPGIQSKNWIASFLTPEELKMALPKKKVKPTIYRLHPGVSIFLAGMARIDYVSGPTEGIYFGVFVSNELYVHTTKTEKADLVYEKHLGGLLSPPLPGDKREGMQPFPPLVPHDLQIQGQSWKKATVDIVFSGIGWISITAPKSEQLVTLRVHMPEGCGVMLRDEPLLPFEAPSKANKNPKLKIHGIEKKIQKKLLRQKKQEVPSEEAPKDIPEGTVKEEDTKKYHKKLIKKRFRNKEKSRAIKVANKAKKKQRIIHTQNN